MFYHIHLHLPRLPKSSWIRFLSYIKYLLPSYQIENPRSLINLVRSWLNIRALNWKLALCISPNWLSNISDHYLWCFIYEKWHQRAYCLPLTRGVTIPFIMVLLKWIDIVGCISGLYLTQHLFCQSEITKFEVQYYLYHRDFVYPISPHYVKSKYEQLSHPVNLKQYSYLKFHSFDHSCLQKEGDY